MQWNKTSSAHGIELIPCQMIFKLETGDSFQGTGLTQGYQSIKDLYRPDSGIQDQGRNKISSVVISGRCWISCMVIHVM